MRNSECLLSCHDVVVRERAGLVFNVDKWSCLARQNPTEIVICITYEDSEVHLSQKFKEKLQKYRSEITLSCDETTAAKLDIYYHE